MINLLSSNLIALPELPSFSRRGIRPRLAPPEKHRARGDHCPKEINRWLGRWENEGGAFVGASTEDKTVPDRNKQNTPNDHATNKIMKRTNHHEEMIRYGDPLMAGSRRRRGGYPVMTYNDRSPEVTAMNAHLRASRYPEQKDEKRFKTRSRLTNGDVLAQNRVHPFLHLGGQYDTQERDNFIKEAVLFVLIVAASIWPIIHSLQAIAAWW